MYSYSYCLELVEQKISQLQFDQEPFELFAPIKYTLDMGGKRIRPCLALMAHSMFSDNLEEVIEPAIGVEIFHNFTLLHDDIMDNSSMRRNHQTVHLKWNNNAAILSGDAMMILAYHQIAKSTPEFLPRIMNLFNKTALEVCKGQQLDMNFEVQQSISEAQYLYMIKLKTAVLLAVSLALGGITGRAAAEDIEKLYECGLNIGIAFQLQDDYLDVFASSNVFGKNLGGDIVANKKTFLLIKALNSDDKEIIKLLNNCMQSKIIDRDEKIKKVTSIFQQLEVDKKSIELANNYFEKGLALFDQVSAKKANKSEITELITKLMGRER